MVQDKKADGREEKQKGTRRKFLGKAVAVSAVAVGTTDIVTATPPTVQPEGHRTELTVSETDGETVHYIIDVTGNSLGVVDSEKESSDENIDYNSGYATAEGYVNNGSDKYYFGDSDRISRVVAEDSGNLEISLSGALDGFNRLDDVVVRGEYWGTKSDDPSMAYSFTSYQDIRKKSNLESNDELNGSTASGYIDPGYKDVWETTAQFTSLHLQPWGHELNIEVEGLPSGTSD